ncbi:hypothetical protein PVAG01_03965 [Phlyctema vagabunda]|uniref:Uncharacterized protein n=1 Tax=Phlyctema vagabunda TaxID=108571 RepID=A0ABR4PN00_9HELO
MSSCDWSSRKRGREFEDDHTASPGFSEHRQKRHIAALPHRISPNSQRRNLPSNVSGSTSYPAPPTITPADSDNEEAAAAEALERSVFSPWSSSPSCAYNASEAQSNYMSDVDIYSDDMDMMDTMHLSPGPFTDDPSPNIAGRIPTPINSSFSQFARPEQLARSVPEYLGEENMMDRVRRGRRLPSPISEGEMSPRVMLEDSGDTDMQVEPTEKPTPPKKGHTRSKHSLRAWTGVSGEVNNNGGPVKRTFSMGYRSDCEKCRMKVPGHFSHIITYD